jgi:hypothetical protein
MKMVTYFNKKDIVDFYNWMFSEEREKSFIHTSAQAAVDGIDLISSWDRLRTVTHADIENWMESKRNPIRKAAPKTDVPMWLQDHMATAPKELQNYVFKVFPERLINSNAKSIGASFAWSGTPEDGAFWSNVKHQNWGPALVELRQKNLL